MLSASNHPGRGTIADAIGAPDRRTMLAAATTAAAHAFISEMPEGYDTPVGDGGVILSASQRLRLAVARTLAADPPAVLVDNPTAYLDAASEASVLPGLEALFRGRNVVILDASPAVTAAARAAAQAEGQLSGTGTDPHSAPAAASALRPDPALPHLHELIDGRAMAPLLGAALEPGAIPDVRVHSVRYKPRDNVVVQYSVQTARGWSTAVAYAAAGVGLEPKSDRRRNSQAGRTGPGEDPGPGTARVPPRGVRPRPVDAARRPPAAPAPTPVPSWAPAWRATASRARARSPSCCATGRGAAPCCASDRMSSSSTATPRTSPPPPGACGPRRCCARSTPRTSRPSSAASAPPSRLTCPVTARA